METDPIAVALKFGFLAVLYLFLFWVARSALDPGERFDLFGGVSLGRSGEADVRIEDRFASQIHARIYPRAGSYYVEDMNSTNGTFLNGNRVDGELQLADRDAIEIGDTEFRFEVEE